MDARGSGGGGEPRCRGGPLPAAGQADLAAEDPEEPDDFDESDFEESDFDELLFDELSGEVDGLEVLDDESDFSELRRVEEGLSVR